ncbi:hypothetical protein BDM02DRAFT_3184946 [Thelephora ganbajun]|uniref:Uncharacterized protein n=1 Tax=Thelephora ganbajun TaxID=370292 RepID=A0ACB6ZNL6_THEGA|nr:hypothetical protein BDM02DRAFT_3184946 [Thelephora ganbajun]
MSLAHRGLMQGVPINIPTLLLVGDEDFSNLGLNDFILAQKVTTRRKLECLGGTVFNKALLERGTLHAMEGIEPYNWMLEVAMGYMFCVGIMVAKEVALTNDTLGIAQCEKDEVEVRETEEPTLDWDANDLLLDQIVGPLQVVEHLVSIEEDMVVSGSPHGSVEGEVPEPVGIWLLERSLQAQEPYYRAQREEREILEDETLAPPTYEEVFPVQLNKDGNIFINPCWDMISQLDKKNTQMISWLSELEV